MKKDATQTLPFLVASITPSLRDVFRNKWRLVAAMKALTRRHPVRYCKERGNTPKTTKVPTRDHWLSKTGFNWVKPLVQWEEGASTACDGSTEYWSKDREGELGRCDGGTCAKRKLTNNKSSHRFVENNHTSLKWMTTWFRIEPLT